MTTIGTKKKSYDIVIQLCEDKLKDIQMHECTFVSVMNMRLKSK